MQYNDMPTDNNEDFVAIEDFSGGIGFNPWETVTVSGATSLANAQFEQMMRLRVDIGVSDWAGTTAKKPRQKPLAKLLDEVAEANKDVFDSLNKVQEEINTLEKTRLIELANKYDTLLFLIVGKGYTLEKATEKTRAGYYNTLTQQLLSTVRGVTNDRYHTLEDFKRVMLRHVSRFVELNDEMIVKFNLLFEELYDYNNTIHAKKKEKRALMGREEKESTVCEDYINVGRESVRFSIGNY